MSIYGIKDYNSNLNVRKSNSIEKQKMDYFFPHNQGQNRTIDYGDKEFYKPRIIKNRKMNDINNYNDLNFRYTNNDIKKANNGNRAYSTNQNSINYYNRNEIVPRIVRNKKNVNKFINNKNNNLREITKENNRERLYRQININKRNRSIDSNSYYNENKKYNKLNYTNDNFNSRINRSIDYESRNENRNQKMNRINRNTSYDGSTNTNEKLISLLCKNCFDKKMLENENPRHKQMDEKEYLNDKFINENPFYFIDKMSDNEKKRINEKIASNSNKQRLAYANFKKQMDNPKEKLQLLNEYSLNPLAIEVGKDPRYLKQKKNYDKKEKLINQNPDKYKALEPRKAYNDYYNKCIYQVPPIEESYYINPVYKMNYIKALKKQIEDKKNEENERKKRQRMAEALANKQFNEYKRRANLNEKEMHNNGIEIMKNDNKQLDDFKKYKNDLLKEREKKLGNELEQKNNEVDRNIKLRNRNIKSENVENYHDWLNEVERKRQNKKEIKDEENKRWNNYIKNYNYKCSHGCYANCDICNRPYEKDKLIRFPIS